MSVAIILICLLSSVLAFFSVPDRWCTIIFLIIFFGGLLVLFVYISAFAQNEITSINKTRIVFLLPPLITMSVFPIRRRAWELSRPFATALFSNSMLYLTLGLISYLLFALFIVSHVTFFHFGALRETFVNTA